MNYTQDITHAKATADFTQARLACEKVLKYDIPLLKLPQMRDDLDEIAESVQKLQQFKDVIILGTGGSSLGAQTLVGLGCRKDAPQLHFMDNIDPHSFDLLFAKLDLKSTGVLSVSKSGTTAETICQTLLTIQQYEAADLRPTDHFIIITEPKESQLTHIANHHKIKTHAHDPNIGGRFSVLSIVGLLPAMLAGIDAIKIRQGAQHALDNPVFAIQGAGLNFAHMNNGLNQTVLMPYIDRLSFLGLWFRQLWAESIGKSGKGTTPIRAMGTVDQHSQLQLYLDGAKDKFFTVITGEFSGDVINTALTPSYLQGKTMGDLMAAEQKATITAMVEKNCPTRIIHIPVLNEAVMGALLMQFMLETMIMAQMMEVDAFDQPAVERGKILTKEYMSVA